MSVRFGVLLALAFGAAVAYLASLEADAQPSGRVEAAVQTYEELLKRDPGHAQAHARLGELALRRGDAKEALIHHLDALRGEDQPDLVLAAAEDFRLTGRPVEATALLERHLARDHDNLVALRALRELGVAAAQWQQALGAQERIVALGSDRHTERGQGTEPAGSPRRPRRDLRIDRCPSCLSWNTSRP